jgi:hypothetical protein
MNWRRLMSYPLAHLTTPKPLLCIAAQLIVEWQRWVKTSKAQNEQMFSGLPPKADIQLWLRAL